MAADELDPAAVEALLFDLGGVVMEVDFQRCISRWATAAGRDAQQIGRRFGFDTAYEQHERGELDIDGYFHSLRRTLEVDLSDDELMAGWVNIYVGLCDGAGALLARTAEQFPLYGYTNSNPTHQAVWSSQFSEVLKYFTSVFVSSEVGHRKPDRAAFEFAAREMGVAPERILFFDDSIENVVGAREAGMQAVHVTSTGSVVQALASLERLP